MAKEQKWGKAHEKLRRAMEKEVDILRELLSNLFQEEVLLTQKDTHALLSIKEDRSKLLKTLWGLRKKRLFATKKIKQLAQTPPDTKKIELKHFLPPDDENSSDLLSLREQIHALHVKMNEQKVRNHYLQQGWSYLKTQPKILPQKKSSVATYEERR